MIVKITRGRAMLGAVQYLEANKNGVVRDDPRIVAGLEREGERLTAESIPGIALELDVPRVLFDTPIREGHVMAVALSVEADERPLDDAELGEVCRDWMREMDFGDVRWVGVRHGVNARGCDHAHLLVNMVREDGTAAPEGWYLKRASRAASVVERKHGLQVLASREQGIGVRGAHHLVLEHAKRLDREPVTHYLERVVRACAIEAPDEHAFVRLVREHGVTVRPRMVQGSATEVAGYSVRLNDGPWFGGGRLARDLTLPRLRQRWTHPAVETADQAAHQAAGRLAAWSIRSEPAPGRIAERSRELGRFAQTRASAGLVLTSVIAAQLQERIAAANREAELQRELDQGFDHRRQEPRIGRGFGIDL